jgi:outer membrane protein assembly factor BamB
MRITTASVRVVMATIAALCVLGGAATPIAHATAPARTSDPGLDWSMWGYDVQRTGHNPNETVLSPSTVPGLHALWTFPFAAKSDNSPVLASAVDVDGTATDMIYAGDRTGEFYGVNATTGQQVWSRDLGDPHVACGGLLGVTDTALIDRSRNVLYVVGSDGWLYALDLGTGATAPGWPFQVAPLDNEFVWGAINIFADQLIVPVASGCDRYGPNYGRVVRVDPNSVTQTAVFYVTGGPDTGVSGGGVWGWGGASIDPADGNVYIATANGYPLDPYEHFMYAENVVRLSADLQLVSANYPGLVGDDVDFGSTPVLYEAAHNCGPQFIAENKDGEILTYDRDDAAAGPVGRAAVSGSGLIGVAGYDPDFKRIYVGNTADSTDGTYTHGLLAFSVAGDCTLHLKWQRALGDGGLSSSPVTANGVVYFGDASGHQLVALDELTHKKVWSSKKTIAGAAQTEPIVINGHVYMTAGTNLYAFGL